MLSNIYSWFRRALLAAVLFANPALGQDLKPPPEVRHVLAGETSSDDPQYSIAATSAISLPAGFYVEEIAPGNSFSTPVAVTFSSDGRIFVVEKRGRVYIVDGGNKLATPFLNIESEVLNHGDRGLLGFALDPEFDTNGYVYLSYTFDWDGSGDYAREDVAARLTRFTVDAVNPNIVDPASRHVLIGETFADGIPSCYYSHTIGTIRFGTDGSLLFGAGDGAHFGQVDPGGLQPTCFGAGKFSSDEDVGAFRSQYLGSLAGKVLRVDKTTGLGLPSNPFFTGAPSDAASRVWALGLRNPYRFTLRPDGSADLADGDPGTLFIGDVGWGTWEDLHVSSGGENFGWPCYEGPNQHPSYQAQAPAHSDCSTLSSQSAPVQYWHHGNTSLSSPPGMLANAIVVGDIYDGYRYPVTYSGRLFYSDYARGWIASSAVDESNTLSDHAQFATGAGAVVDVRFDAVSDYLYYVDVSAGKVWRLRHNDENSPPVAVATSDIVDGYAPLSVQFTGSQSFDPDVDPLTYAWDFGDGQTSDLIDPPHIFAGTGVYQVVLTVSDDAGASDQAFLQIAVDNTYPVATITAPGNGQAFAIGETVSLAGTGTDAQDGSEGLTYEWRVTQQHNSHDHPDFFSSSVSSDAFVVDQHGVDFEVSFLKVQLVVTDTGGLTDTTEHVVEVRRRGEHDVTDDGTPVALVTAPSGSGNPDLGVIADGVVPAPGTTDPLLHYDTFDGSAKAIDWIGYEFATTKYLAKVVLTQGAQSPVGGWFETLDVEVRVDGAWEPVNYLNVLRPYEGDNGIGFDTYTMLFEGVWADGVRVIGTPGGPDKFVSVGEMRVFELGVVEFSADETGGLAPLAVGFSDESSIANAWTWTWDFGDGTTSSERHPVHTYQSTGAYDVTLSITSPHGAFARTKSAYVVAAPPGLLGQYFDNMDFTGDRLLRNDATIDFEWGSGSPAPTIGADRFSVRWTGWVRPQYSETYAFHTTTDDGVRLWVNGQLVVDQWVPQAPTEWTGTIALLKDTFYSVVMEYYEDGGGAVAHLEWSSPSQVRQIIPESSMRSGTVTPRVAAFDPKSGDYFDAVHIYGENLGQVTEIQFGGHPATTIGVVSDGHVWAHVPESAVTGVIRVQTPEGPADSYQSFGVADGTLSVELEHFRAFTSEDGVIVSWRLLATSSVVGITVEHAAHGESAFKDVAYFRGGHAANEHDFQTGVRRPGIHRFRLRLDDENGGFSRTAAVEVQVGVPGVVELAAPYPNPFAEYAVLGFSVARAQHVEVSVYDMIGRRILILFSADVDPNRPEQVVLRATGTMPSGLYLVRFKGEYFAAEQMITRVAR